MNTDEMASLLSEVDLFSDLDRERLLELAEEADERHYASGQLLYAQDAPANELWVVAKGAVALTVAEPDGTEKVISRRQRPEAFGEAALYDKGGRMVSAQATEDSDVLTLDGERFRQLVHDEPDVAEKLLRLMAGVIRASTQRR